MQAGQRRVRVWVRGKARRLDEQPQAVGVGVPHRIGPKARHRVLVRMLQLWERLVLAGRGDGLLHIKAEVWVKVQSRFRVWQR